MKKIVFVKSPIARYKLGYTIGQEADLPNELAAELIKEGYAKEAAKATGKTRKLTAVSKSATKRKKR